MAKTKLKMLYVYEERIPNNLRELVLSTLEGDVCTVVDSMTYQTPDSEKIEKLKKAEAVFFAPGRHLDDAVLAHARHIKLMQLWSSGYDKFNVAGATRYGIPVANNGGANASSVAEHAVLLMLAVYKWLPNSCTRTVTGDWKGNSHGMDMFTLEGKTLGIIGFGNIGRQVAKKVRGFGMEVLYYDIKRADGRIEKELKARFTPLEELLKTSDIITLHLHLNEQSRNIIGEKEFNLMKKGAVLINVSRAQLVEPTAFFGALKNNKIHGAGLDVYLEEPTSPNDPLLTLPNVVATPHMAGTTYDAYISVLAHALENFRRVRNGKPPLWVVNNAG